MSRQESATCGLIVRVEHDHLEILVRRVLSDPVRVEDAEPLGDGLQVPLRLLLLHGAGSW